MMLNPKFTNYQNTLYLSRFPVFVTLFLAFAMANLSCEEDFEAFEGDSYPFSIYGYITPDYRTNYIRVQDLTSPLIADSTAELDATVLLENVETGNETVLEDSVVQFEDVYFHNFVVRKSIEFDHKYRLTIQQDDGPNTTTTATTPRKTTNSSYTPVDRCDVNRTFTIDNVADKRNLDEVLIGYHIDGMKRWFEVPDGDIYESEPNTFSFSYEPMDIINMHLNEEDYDDDEWEFIENECYEMANDRFVIQYTVLSDDWFGQDIRPINPLETKDIDGGLGLFGGLYEDEFEVEIDTMELPYCDYSFFNPAKCECPPENEYDECPPPDDE